MRKFVKSDHPTDIDMITDLAIQIVKPTLYLHGLDIIHRDLKPANYLVSKKDGRFVIKLTDFGISRALDSSGGLEVQQEGTPQVSHGGGVRF